VTPDTTPSAFFDFGPFRLDPARRRLMRDGEPVKLTAKAYDVLDFWTSAYQSIDD
jgi:DNA-binding winged helix-turn-helix (wHTH) protein